MYRTTIDNAIPIIAPALSFGKHTRDTGSLRPTLRGGSGLVCPKSDFDETSMERRHCSRYQEKLQMDRLLRGLQERPSKTGINAPLRGHRASPLSGLGE